MIQFFVPGVPRSTQSGTVVRARGRAIPIRRGGGWSTLCRAVAAQHRPNAPLLGPVAVTLMFVMPRPKRAAATYPRRPDLGNTSKGVLDAFNGVLWVDDSQVVRLVERKSYGTRPGVGVLVEDA